MSSTTTMSPLMSTANVLNESPFESSDELMLEELERRDGIYSFIFHELEAPKCEKNADEPERIPLPTSYCRRLAVIDKINSKNNDLSATMTSASLQTATKTVATHACSVKSSSNSISSNNNNGISLMPANEPLLILPTKNDFLRYHQNLNLKTWYPPLLPTASTTSTTSSMKLLHTSSTIAGGPAASFYLNKRQPSLYPYMMNCAVSVRKQPPRFSHITTPLVRNRRHALKECEAYKQRSIVQSTGGGSGGGGNNLLTPDLRSLFPHDPDVHAPFIKSDQKLAETETAPSCFPIESLKKSDSPARLPSCSEIKYEKCKI